MEVIQPYNHLINHDIVEAVNSIKSIKEGDDLKNNLNEEFKREPFIHYLIEICLEVRFNSSGNIFELFLIESYRDPATKKIVTDIEYVDKGEFLFKRFYFNNDLI